MNVNFLHESAFLNALGNAILQSFWQFFLLWLVYELIIAGTKNINAKFKHNLSVVSVLLSLLIFCYTFLAKLITPPIETADAVFNNNLITSSLNTIFLKSALILPFLSLAYLLLAVFFLIKLATAYRNIYFFTQKNLITAPGYLQHFTNKVAAEIRLPKKVSIWISEHIEVPATIGFLKPVILIPFSVINHLSPLQLEAIILHELSHIKRNDYLVNLVISVVETLLFFNPIITIFIGNIRRERENCCDDFVLNYQYDAYSYASALLSLEQNRVSNLHLSLSSVSGKKQLFSRIKRMMGGNGSGNEHSYLKRFLALSVITIFFFSVSFFFPENISQSSEMPKVVQVDPKKTYIQEEVKDKEADVNISILSNEFSKSESVDTRSALAENKRQALVPEQEESYATNDDKIIARHMSGNTELAKPSINYEEINQALQLAYEEINKVDWAEVQNGINEGLSALAKTEANTKHPLLNELFANIPQVKVDINSIKELQKLKKYTHLNQKFSDSLRLVIESHLVR